LCLEKNNNYVILERFIQLVDMDKDVFREKIVRTAAEVFQRYGYRKTTMGDIANELRKGKSSIYYYFAGKEEIYQEVVESEARGLKNEIMASIAQVSDPIEQIKAYVLTRMRVYKKALNFYNALKNDNLLHLEFIDSLRKKYDEEEIALVNDILRKGVKSARFRIKNVKLASIAIVTALKGLEFVIYEDSDEQTLEERLDSLLNVLFYGIVIR
jgi:AcrR family transcriptional regulator